MIEGWLVVLHAILCSQLISLGSFCWTEGLVMINLIARPKTTARDLFGFSIQLEIFNSNPKLLKTDSRIFFVEERSEVVRRTAPISI